MKIEVNHRNKAAYTVGGLWGALLASAIVCVTFLFIAIVFAAVVVLIASPLIFIIWLIVQVVT